MKLYSISVSRYRSISAAKKIRLGKSTVLIGPNNEGKSNILRALVLAMRILTTPRRLPGLRLPSHVIQKLFGYNWELDFPINLQKKNPNGETHEDLTVFSQDESRNLIVIRQFNIEGYVNTFVLDTIKSDNRNFVFVSEATENSPKGLKARLTYKINNKDEFTEYFELAFPGKDYEIWLRNFWRRNRN